MFLVNGKPMTIEELRTLYHDGTIPDKGKKEIKQDFIGEFGYASLQQYIQMLKIGGERKPTPKEFEWLSERIQKYHNYYSESQPA